MSTPTGAYDFVVVANRLPVDRVEHQDGTVEWKTSPGGLVTALHPVMQKADGAWVGWSGAAGPAPEAVDAQDMHCVAVPLSEEEVEEYYSGFSNATLWPLYHDVIVAPEFHREWWSTYVKVNQRFAEAAAAQAASGATVWVHDYQLQLVPAQLRRLRPDLKIGFFNHIPFPGYEIFAQLPWRRQVVEGLLGADLIGFQRQGDVTNFLRASRRAAQLTTRGATIKVPRPTGEESGGDRVVRAAAFPISIDVASLEDLARSEGVRQRALEIRSSLGDPDLVLLGVDRLDYTKGILHRLKAYGELLQDGKLEAPSAVLVQVASPSRERVEQYQLLRDEVEVTVGRINGDYGHLGQPAVHYLHQSHDRAEMAALYLASDIMLVTSLRDGMNLVAKEYIACRQNDDGALVLSEFTGAADELPTAYLVNPHDIQGVKETVMRAVDATPREARRRMRALRVRLRSRDVAAWASAFLSALQGRPTASAGDEERKEGDGGLGGEHQ